MSLGKHYRLEFSNKFVFSDDELKYGCETQLICTFGSSHIANKDIPKFLDTCDMVKKDWNECLFNLINNLRLHVV